MIRIFTITVSIMLLAFCSQAQVFSNKVVGKKNEALKDSIISQEYPYILPIWGEKATKKGFDLPYSAGVSVQYLTMKQDLIIDNLMVGFNNGEMFNLDQVVRFNNSTSQAQGVNIRPDFWVFPFLNVYGIFAKSKPTTTVGFGIYVPDSNSNWKEVLSTSTKAEFNALSFGFGITPTIGIAGGFLALDMNFTWTDIDALDKPAFSYIFDPRIGKSFRFKNNKDRNFALWTGGFRWSINSGTSGSLPITDLMPVGEWQNKVNQGYTRVDESQKQVETWWGNLGTAGQKNPVNIAKYEAANKALGTAGKFLDGANNAVNNASNSSVQYSLDKRPAMKWNLLVGGQFQYNKHWMLRGEYGFLGSRNHFFVGLQYRFGL